MFALTQPALVVKVKQHKALPYPAHVKRDHNQADCSQACQQVEQGFVKKFFGVNVGNVVGLAARKLAEEARHFGIFFKRCAVCCARFEGDICAQARFLGAFCGVFVEQPQLPAGCIRRYRHQHISHNGFKRGSFV